MHCSILLFGCVFCVLFFAYAAASRVSWGTDLGGKFRKHTRPTHYDVVTSCDGVVGIDFTQQACVSVCLDGRIWTYCSGSYHISQFYWFVCLWNDFLAKNCIVDIK